MSPSFTPHTLPPLQPYNEIFMPSDSHWPCIRFSSPAFGVQITQGKKSLQGLCSLLSLESESGFVPLRIWDYGHGLRASFRDIRAGGAQGPLSGTNSKIEAQRYA